MELAVNLSKVPLSVRGVNEVDERVEGGHRGVGERQVQQEIVGHGAHPFMGQNDPNNDEVSEHSDRQHEAVRDRPNRDAPRRLHELICEITRYV